MSAEMMTPKSEKYEQNRRDLEMPLPCCFDEMDAPPISQVNSSGPMEPLQDFLFPDEFLQYTSPQWTWDENDVTSFGHVQYEYAFKLIRESGEAVSLEELALENDVSLAVISDLAHFLGHLGAAEVSEDGTKLVKNHEFHLMDRRKQLHEDISGLDQELKAVNELTEEFEMELSQHHGNPYAHVTKEDLDLRENSILIAKTANLEKFVLKNENKVLLRNVKEVVLVNGVELFDSKKWPEKVLTKIDNNKKRSYAQVIDKLHGFKRAELAPQKFIYPVELTDFKNLQYSSGKVLSDGRSVTQALLEEGVDPEYVEWIKRAPELEQITKEERVKRRNGKKYDSKKRRREENRREKEATGQMKERKNKSTASTTQRTWTPEYDSESSPSPTETFDTMRMGIDRQLMSQHSDKDLRDWDGSPPADENGEKDFDDIPPLLSPCGEVWGVENVEQEMQLSELHETMMSPVSNHQDQYENWPTESPRMLSPVPNQNSLDYDMDGVWEPNWHHWHNTVKDPEHQSPQKDYDHVGESDFGNDKSDPYSEIDEPLDMEDPFGLNDKIGNDYFEIFPDNYDDS